MSLLMRTVHSGAGSNAVRLWAVNTAQNRFTSPCYSGIRLGADGRFYIQYANGGWGSVGDWLLFGSASDFNVTRTIDSGTLTTDAGAGPLALSSDRSYAISNTSWDSTKQTVVTLEIDAGGGTIASLQYTLAARLYGGDVDDGGGYRPTWQRPQLR